MAAIQVRHTRNVSTKCMLVGTASSFLEFLPHARARVCGAYSPIVSFCQSDDITIYSASVFLLPFFVFAPETVQRIQGPLTTRVIIERPAQSPPPPPSFASPPDPFRLHCRKVPHDLFYYFSLFFFYHYFSPTYVRVPIIHRLYTDAVPKRKHTSGQPAACPYSSVPG